MSNKTVLVTRATGKAAYFEDVPVDEFARANAAILNGSAS